MIFQKGFPVRCGYISSPLRSRNGSDFCERSMRFLGHALPGRIFFLLYFSCLRNIIIFKSGRYFLWLNCSRALKRSQCIYCMCHYHRNFYYIDIWLRAWIFTSPKSCSPPCSKFWFCLLRRNVIVNGA